MGGGGLAERCEGNENTGAFESRLFSESVTTDSPFLSFYLSFFLPSFLSLVYIYL